MPSNRGALCDFVFIVLIDFERFGRTFPVPNAKTYRNNPEGYVCAYVDVVHSADYIRFSFGTGG
jgi:hypothetical protein